MTIRRRQFITLLGGAAAWPMAASAQQAALPVVGFLSSGSPDLFAHLVRSFRQGLGENGYVEGQNVAIDYRWADDQYDRLAALAADLVRRQVAVIVTNGPGALPAMAATAAIPIVFTIAADPVEIGLVVSLNRPGANLTGIVNLNLELGPKRLELLHELIPTASSIAFLINPANPNADTSTRDLQAAARRLGLQLQVLHASTERDLNSIFASLAQLRPGALVIGTDAFFNSRSAQLGALAVRHAVPTIYQGAEFVAAGGLMSYGGSLTELYRLVGVYVGRILKGEKPADLPVQQYTKVELVLNLKTAKALGLTVPLSLLTRADEVIE